MRDATQATMWMCLVTGYSHLCSHMLRPCSKPGSTCNKVQSLATMAKPAATACCCRQAVLLNLKFNEVVASFANAAGVGSGDQLRASATKPKPGGGACTCIAFRTGSGVPLMAAGGGAGVITVWNLEERRLHTIVKVLFPAFACSLALCDHAQTFW